MAAVGVQGLQAAPWEHVVATLSASDGDSQDAALQATQVELGSAGARISATMVSLPCALCSEIGDMAASLH